MTEPIWTKDPSILFSPQTWQKFVPTKDMDVPAALNSIVRFTTYFAILLYAATGNHLYVFAIPLVLATTVVFSSVFPNTRTLVETFTVKSKDRPREYTMPSAANPFMNPLLTDIVDNPNRADAAPVTSKAIKREIEKAFEQTSDIYMDTSDRFDRTQAMRTFSTLQSAKIPNDQDGFLNFLAKGIDEPNNSSAFPARLGKIGSESYVSAKGSLGALPSSIDKPSGVTPSGALHK
jgi:hypothetical protein